MTMLESLRESLRTSSDEPLGVEVVHKDGTREWYDPVTDQSISENATDYLIDNGFYVYNEPKKDVAELRKYVPVSTLPSKEKV